MILLGIRIDNLSKKKAIEKIVNFLDGGQHKIFTPNPEMLVDASRDDYFREVLNSGSLNICDGSGIKLVSKEKIQRIPGIDFMLDICQVAESKGKSIYLLGSGSREVLDKTIVNLKLKFTNLRIAGSNQGPKIEMQKENERIVNKIDQNQNEQLVDDIIMAAPDILFVGFGHSKQEKWIDENLSQLPSIKIAMGVGGSFDYIAGKIKRAPKLVQRIGFEWLWRLIHQPSRIKRIYKATAVFMFKVFFTKKAL